jgi:hypothetical protein
LLKTADNIISRTAPGLKVNDWDRKPQTAYFVSEKFLVMDGPIEIEALNLCVGEGEKPKYKTSKQYTIPIG